MEQDNHLPITKKDIKIIALVSAFAAAVGAVMGVAAYYQQWLG